MGTNRDEKGPPGAKGLVVDDSKVMRRMMEGVLTLADVTEVVHAADGIEAVAACETHDFAVILMDWSMPNMDGIDATRAIRAGGGRMPIIMVSTESEKDHIVRARKAGVNKYVVKPFVPQKLVVIIKDIIKENTSRTRMNMIE